MIHDSNTEEITGSADGGALYALKNTSAPIGARAKWKTPILILLSLFAFYLLMFQRYRPYDIDNPWFLSFSYNTCVEHIYTDQFMNVRFPGGMDGTQLFGKLAAYTQCGVLGLTGWNQWCAVILAATLVVLSLGMWWLQLRKLEYSDSFNVCFLVAAGISEPFLSTANKFRYEHLSFALLSLGLLLISYRKPLWGMFVAALAVEMEPIALAGVIAALVLACSVHKMTRGLIVRLVFGVSLAGAIYLALHPNVIHIGHYLSQVKQKEGVHIGGFVATYFLRRLRHLPEAICFIVAAVFYWRRRQSMRSHYFGLSALAITLFSIVMPHGNASYMIFLYPFLLGMALVAFRAEHRARLTLFIVILYVVPQYGFLMYMNRNQGYRLWEIQKASRSIRDASQQLGIRDEQLRIYGDYGLWFAHPHFYRAASMTTTDYIQDADLYLCYDSWSAMKGLAPAHMFYCPDLKQRLPLRLLSTIPMRDRILHLYAKR